MIELDAERRKLLRALNGTMVDNETIDLDEVRARAVGIAQFVSRGLGPVDIQWVVDKVLELHSVELKIGIGVINKSTFQPWIEARKESVPRGRWDAYEELLLRREWSPRVVDKLDAQTDQIVDLMGDPTKGGEWARRGLAIGEVQSGKTATYIGVLNKAIDYGYKLIVIIGGHTEDLRRQTQRRVDTDLTGLDSLFMSENIAQEATIRVGVGQINETLQANVLTTARSDFNAASKRAGVVAFGDTPSVFVIKKNARVLANLAAYLKRQAPLGQHTLPLVVIDDEADWASINTKSEDEVAAVNKGIRHLLSASSRNSYMGITATPFANVLIDDEVEDDLFPRDYIQSLESPSNYQGIETYLGGGPGAANHRSIITDVSDCLEILPFSHKRTRPVDALPESMMEALSAFYVGAAIRLTREDGPRPAAMMINVSRFNDVQAKIASLTEIAVSDINAAVLAEFALPENRAESISTGRLRRMFEREYSQSGVTWSEVRPHVVAVAEGIRVELVNGLTMAARNKRLSDMSRDARFQESLRPTVFIGGDVLARGLTLDGLQVSYYVRRAGAADTLLQMGRWFGYRPRYEDLVRIWIDDDVVNLFKYVAELSADLRASLREMNALELTPKDFGLKMRRHPESFMITAANKQKHGVAFEGLISIHGATFESHVLSSHAEDRARNLEAVKKFAGEVHALGPAENPQLRSGNHQLWRSVPADRIECLFTEFRGYDHEPFFGRATAGQGSAQLAAYLADAKNGDSWDVAFVSGSGRNTSLGPITVKSSVRDSIAWEHGAKVLRMGNRRVAAGSDLKNVLTTERVRVLEQESPEQAKLTEGMIARNALERPVILVFAITTSRSTVPEEQILDDEPLVALKVAFPGLTAEEELVELEQGHGARFIVNKVFARINFGMPTTEDDDEVEE